MTTRPNSKPKGTRTVHWRCLWCGAGGHVVAPTYENPVDDDFQAAKLIELAHQKSGLCHIMRHLLHVRTSLTKPIPK